MWLDSGYGFRWDYPTYPSKIAFTLIDYQGTRHIHLQYKENGYKTYRVVRQEDILRLEDSARSFLMSLIVMIDEGMFDLSEDMRDACYLKKRLAISR